MRRQAKMVHPSGPVRTRTSAAYLKILVPTAALAVASLSPAGAQEDMTGLFGGTGGMPFRLMLAPEYTYYSSGDVEGQSTALGLARYGLSATARLYKGENDSWTLSTSVKTLQLDTEASLPATGNPVPDEFSRVGLGLNYSRKFDGGSTMRAGLNVGSASDVPFGSNDRAAYTGMFSFTRPTEEGNTWLLFVFMTNTHEEYYYLPIPGVAYLYRGERHTAILGFPFAWVNYRPAKRWALDFSYFPITSVRAKVTYKPRRGLGVYAGYNWRHDSYFRADRVSDDDRFFNYEMRAAVGVKARFSRKASADVSVGWAFDRFMFEGEGLDAWDEDRVDLADAFFAQVKLGIVW